MKSGSQIGKETVEKLRVWLEAHKDSLPRFPDGTLNKSAIARAALIDRQVFTTNPGAKELLAQYGTPSSRPHSTGGSAQDREILKKKDSEIARLRDLVARREVELAALRKEVKAAKELQRMHETMVETLRHVKPLP